MARNHVECYNTAGSIPGVEPGMGIKERARLTTWRPGIAHSALGRRILPRIGTFTTHERLNFLRTQCEQAREGVGPEWG
jgi:hypothetical protein